MNMKRFIIHVWDKRSGFMLSRGDLPYEFIDFDVAKEIADLLNSQFPNSYAHIAGEKVNYEPTNL